MGIGSKLHLQSGETTNGGLDGRLYLMAPTAIPRTK